MRIAVAQKVKVKEDNRKNEVPSLTTVADNARLLTKKDWRLAKKLSRLQRKIDKKYAKLNDDYDVAGDLVILNNREYRQAIKLADTLRKSDKATLHAQKIEKQEKHARYEQAQLEVR